MSQLDIVENYIHKVDLFRSGLLIPRDNVLFVECPIVSERTEQIECLPFPRVHAVYLLDTR